MPHVHAAARRVDAIEEAAGDRVVAHALDVGDRDAITQLAERLTDAGPLHALVVAAGINIKRRRFEETSQEDWDRVLATNLTGAFNLVRALLPALRETRGDVVLIGSVSGSWTDRSGAAYQASKAGLHALARGGRVRRAARQSASPRSPPAWSTRRSSRTARRCRTPRCARRC